MFNEDQVRAKAMEFLAELSDETTYEQENYSLVEDAFINLAQAFRNQLGEDENGRTDEEIEELAEQCENFEDPGLPVEGWEFLLGMDVQKAYQMLQVAKRISK